MAILSLSCVGIQSSHCVCEVNGGSAACQWSFCSSLNGKTTDQDA
jgi:hypothetical protein